MLERVKTLIRQRFQYFVLFLKSFTFVLLVVENVCILTNFLKNVVISMLSSNYRCVFLRLRAWNRWCYAFPDIFIADLISPETILPERIYKVRARARLYARILKMWQKILWKCFHYIWKIFICELLYNMLRKSLWIF